MIVIGIDPGLDGALAVLDAGAIVYDAPTARDGKRRRYLVSEMRLILEDAWRRGGSVGCAAIERVHAMPKQGVASSFNFGEGFGLWQGLLAGLSIPFDLVEPARWKKVMLDGRAKEKEASRIRAQELFPSINLSLKKHHGRADALLIAEYRRRQR